MNNSRENTRTEAPGAESLLFLILDVAQELEQRLEAELGKQGLSLAKAGTLHTLAKAKEPLSLSELAERNECVRSNVTQLVDRLETDGLVRRVNDPDDRRVVRAALTTTGRKAYEEAARVVASQERGVAEALGEDEVLVLSKLLGRLIS